jgi:hypothetical protein
MSQIMDEHKSDRREHTRIRCEGVVTLGVQSGSQRGSMLVSWLHDISDGGLCVVLDGGTFERGTAVSVGFGEEFTIPAWVCHSTKTSTFCRLGLSFQPVDAPDYCWEERRCRWSPVDLAL